MAETAVLVSWHGRLLAALAMLVLVTSPAAAQPSKATAIDSRAAKFFEDKVRPVLANRCFSCHGPEKQKGQLRLDSLAGMLKGGRIGPAIEPGKPDKSLLVRAIQHGEELQMPPRSKLPQQEIALLAAWVKMGAPWPMAGPIKAVVKGPAGPVFTREQRDFWAFQQPIAVVPPTVKNSSWVRSPIDRFILAKLEQKGLTPAPSADRRTLLRRATFDLTGLPPTPEEMDAFLKDESAVAFARVVDRLLASPHYGQRWGRHWLDVARYSDSNGMDENLAFGNAHRYRDWVIAAFNNDMPYDRFVREQIAGDLMLTGDAETDAGRVIATGFLAIGPKMLAEDDPVKMEMDIIDEQVDTLGRTFLGMTLGCARCHDHKFDPIAMTDYYGLAGIFKSTKTMDNFRVVARWHERPIAGKEEQEKARQHEARLAEKRAAIEKLKVETDHGIVAKARKDLPRYLKAAAELASRKDIDEKPVLADPKAAGVAGIIVIEAENYTRGNVLKSFTGYGDKIGVIYNQGQLPNVAEYDINIPDAGAYQVEIRYAAADARPVQLTLNDRLIKDAAEQATGSWYPDTQRWFVEGVFAFKEGKNTLRLERAQPFPHIDKLALVPAKLPAAVAHLVPKSAERLASEQNLNPIFLRQWAAALKRLGKAPSTTEIEKLASDPKGPFAVAVTLEASYPEMVAGRLKGLRDKLAKLEKARPKLPEAMSVSEAAPVNLRVHLRGSHLNLGAEVPRRFPTILSGTRQPAIDKKSGRLELADWLTRPDNPLTARVMVNRIWLHHFGAALVRSPDNFGLLGDRPAHRELLDWLAVRFAESGWSIKAMHRLIMLSSVYQMSTAHSEPSFLADPENRLHWRMNRRRLEAEAVRDSILAVSGQLDPTMGGSLLVTKNRAYVASTFSVNPTNYDSSRRSVYLPVVRSALYEVLQAFDFADPSVANGERASTTVAPQALFMMNSDLVQTQSRKWAERLVRRGGDDPARIQAAYERALGRPASSQEVERAMGFLRGVEQALPEELPAEERRTRAWASLCRVILASNEFIYIE